MSRKRKLRICSVSSIKQINKKFKIPLKRLKKQCKQEETWQEEDPANMENARAQKDAEKDPKSKI